MGTGEPGCAYPVEREWTWELRRTNEVVVQGLDLDGFDLDAQAGSLDVAVRPMLRKLWALGQRRPFSRWAPPGKDTERKQRLLEQAADLDRSLPEGLGGYLRKAKELLEAARRGDNPYADFLPREPPGTRLGYGTEDFRAAEAQGLGEAKRTGFVLVAGGLGERLGYRGIKLEIAAESATNRSFLELYIQNLLALDARRCSPPPAPGVRLAIMVSDDTHGPTQRLLDENAQFGFPANRVTLLRQEQVPALADDQPSLATRDEDPYELVTKPHGHGDVHRLLYSSGLSRKWLEEGLRWLVLFQDTNALAFHAVPAALGVSARLGLAVNSVAIPRTPGEAIGAIVHLVSADRQYVVNVEYNQLDALLRSTSSPQGDVPDATGVSPYPGNTNILVLDLAQCVETLERTGGLIPEFVNPKYADPERTRFKSPARLECMMQDFPKLLEGSARVAYTQFERSLCFSPVKNGISSAESKAHQGLPPESAASAEADLYAMHRRILAAAGASVREAEPERLAGLSLRLYPAVVLSPRLAIPSVPAWRVNRTSVSERSVLIMDCDDIEIDNLTLDGALVVRGVPGARIVLRNLAVHNAGWHVEPSADHGDIRGFVWVRSETRVIDCDTPGEHVISV